jgi:hypothetical protein
VVGEAQILGQVRRAFETARAGRTTGPLLNHTLQAALARPSRASRDRWDGWPRRSARGAGAVPAAPGIGLRAAYRHCRAGKIARSPGPLRGGRRRDHRDRQPYAGRLDAGRARGCSHRQPGR